MLLTNHPSENVEFPFLLHPFVPHTTAHVIIYFFDYIILGPEQEQDYPHRLCNGVCFTTFSMIR